MKILKITALVLASIIALVLLISFFLPSKVRVERSLEVKAKPNQAYKLVSNMHNWKLWSPWHKLDSNTQWTYTKEEEGKGAGYSWKSENPNVGEGSLQIIECTQDSFIKAIMNFGKKGNSFVSFTFAATENGTKITWSMDNDASTMPLLMQPISKYFFLMMDQMVGPDFEQGLKNMQVILESQKSIFVGDFEAEIRDFKGMNYVGIRQKLKGAEISQKLGEFYAQLQSYLSSQKTSMQGPPFTINYSAKGDVYDMKAALGTSFIMAPELPIEAGELKPGKWLVVKYYGAYDKISPVYQLGFEYLAHNKLMPSGAPMEFYLSDPMMEKDTSKWLTEVVFPCIE
ncbi:MAG: hypothetical protein CFE21_02705 [Bacteroidetes bacterium B1(2017)]|nr:MAG: hypothetical protein CFE21_02705 [Bacteroidetes bacterium B1(2017)]